MELALDASNVTVTVPFPEAGNDPARVISKLVGSVPKFSGVATAPTVMVVVVSACKPCCGTPIAAPSVAKLVPTVSSTDSLASRLKLPDARVVCRGVRSEEHTSELQSRGHLVCRLLLEKKK